MRWLPVREREYDCRNPARKSRQRFDQDTQRRHSVRVSSKRVSAEGRGSSFQDRLPGAHFCLFEVIPRTIQVTNRGLDRLETYCTIMYKHVHLSNENRIFQRISQERFVLSGSS